MQKWEYLFVRATNERHANGRDLQEVVFINAEKNLVDKSPLKSEIADRYGAEGWELVAIDFEESGYWEMVFKRSKTEKPPTLPPIRK
ncbi:MAG TPA: hypothetical protein VJU84_07515 [Pyrinomonadaceae bacterium]|nr:hypothetical protein [Pyrinomonadaceae bacterium]